MCIARRHSTTDWQGIDWSSRPITIPASIQAAVPKLNVSHSPKWCHKLAELYHLFVVYCTSFCMPERHGGDSPRLGPDVTIWMLFIHVV